MAIHLAHKQTTAAVRAIFWTAIAHACVRLMGNGLEVNPPVQVCHNYGCVVDCFSACISRYVSH